MKPPRMLVWVAMLLLCAGGIWLWATIGGGEAPQLQDAGAREQRNAEPVAGSTDARVRENSRVEVATQEAAAAATTGSLFDSEPGAASVVIVGRCVDLDTRGPVPGIAMRLHGKPASEIQLARYEQELRWQDPEPVRTDADGRFAFVVEPEPPLSFDLRPEDPAWIMQQKHWQQLTPPKRIDLGDVPLRRLQRQQVRVVDFAGAPVVGITLRVHFWDLRMPGAYRDLRATSGDDGIATFDPGLPRGELSYEVIDGLAWRSSGRLRVEPSGALPTVVVERLPAAVAGTVVDARGMPAAELDVIASVKGGRGPGTTLVARTAADGSFELPAMHPAPEGWLLRTSRPWLDPTLGARAFADGTRDLRLQITEFGAIEVEVTAAESGAPVERFAVGWHRVQAQSHRNPQGTPALHPHGRARLDGFAPGTWQIQVIPGDPALAASTPTDVVVQPAQTASLRVALQPARVVRASVLHEGAPVAGASVELLHVPDAAKWNPRTDCVDLVPALGWSQAKSVFRVGSAVTDASGWATIRGATHAAVHARARVDGFLPVVQPVPPGAGEVTLELVRGASLQVRLQPDGIAAELARVTSNVMQGELPQQLRLFELAGDPQSHRGLLTKLDADTAQIDGLAVGPCNLGLSIPGLYRFENQRFDNVAFEQRVILSAAAEQQVEFDLSSVRPATVALTVMTEQGPLRRGYVYLYQHSEGSFPDGGLVPMGQYGATTDENGRLPPQVMLPADYAVMVRDDGQVGLDTETLEAEAPLTVAPGQELTTTVLVRRGQVRLTVQGLDGELLRHCRIHIDAGPRYPATTDTRGTLTLGRPRSATIKLELRRADNPLRTFTWLPDGTDTAVAEIDCASLTGATGATVTLRPKQ